MASLDAEPEMVAYLERYHEIRNYFHAAVKATGLSFAAPQAAGTADLRRRLAAVGVSACHDGRSYRHGFFSPACAACRTGVGTRTFILTLDCNRSCFFCSNKNQHNYATAQGLVNDVIAEFELFTKECADPECVALTGGEPLLHPQLCLDFYRHVKAYQQNIHTRLYTNADLLSAELLDQLEPVLDEIRISIKHEDGPLVSEALQHKLELVSARNLDLLVEMPVLPGTYEEMTGLLELLDAHQVKGINLLEFLFPWVNAEDYLHQGYQLKANPYRVLYGYDYAGGLPIAGSEEDALRCLLYAAEQGLQLGVHYCSLENKLTAQIFHQNRGIALEAFEMRDPEDFFIKSIKVFGSAAQRARRLLAEVGSDRMCWHAQERMLEMHPADVSLLQGQIAWGGLCYSVGEVDEQGRYVREIQMDPVRLDSYIFKG